MRKAMIATLLLVLSSCCESEAKPKAKPKRAPVQNLILVTKEGCVPCKHMLAEVPEEGYSSHWSFSVEDFDTSKDKEVRKTTSVPTLIAKRDGVVMGRLHGKQPVWRVRSWLRGLER